MSLDPRREESPLNLTDRKQLIENIKKSLEECELGQEEQHLLTIGSKRLLLLWFYSIFQKALEQEQMEFSL